MDLVSFETAQEYRHFATMMYYGEYFVFHLYGFADLVKRVLIFVASGNTFNEFTKYLNDNRDMLTDNISSIWTSGRKCNFQKKGCDAAHLQPVNING